MSLIAVGHLIYLLVMNRLTHVGEKVKELNLDAEELLHTEAGTGQNETFLWI